VQSQPLLTNDPAGVVKLLGSLATSAGVVVYGFWRIMSSKVMRDNADKDKAINGVGTRVDACVVSDARAHTRIDELVRRADAKDVEVREVTGDIGRLEAKVDQTLAQGLENKMEIIGEFQKIANELRGGMHSLDVKVEKLETKIDERDRVRAA
jgi:hypothetical protein